MGYIKRKDDGEIFTENEDGSFSNQWMKDNFANHLILKWPKKTLLEQYKEYFEWIDEEYIHL